MSAFVWAAAKLTRADIHGLFKLAGMRSMRPKGTAAERSEATTWPHVDQPFEMIGCAPDVEDGGKL